VRHSVEPQRQCIGCRKVRRKKELIRLVFLPSGQIAFDRTHTGQGRGIYLCPESYCFVCAYKNKRWKKHFQDINHLEDLFRGIQNVLLNAIKRYFALGLKTQSLKDTKGEIENIQKEDVVIVNRDITPDQREKIYKKAQKRRAELIDIQGDCMMGTASVVIKNNFPMITHLKRDLRLYKKLSTKGLVI
jgi:predicted RNA-binding protein YlxR (DUF448 family)